MKDYRRRDPSDISRKRLTSNAQFIRNADADVVPLHELGDDWHGFYGYAVTRDGRILSYRRHRTARSLGTHVHDYVDFSSPRREISTHNKKRKPYGYVVVRTCLTQWDIDAFGVMDRGAPGVKRWVTVSNIVCTAWHGDRPSPKHVAAHVNGDSTDNRAENLVWATPAENTDDTAVHRALDLLSTASAEQMPFNRLNPGLQALVRAAHEYYERMALR